MFVVRRWHRCRAHQTLFVRSQPRAIRHTILPYPGRPAAAAGAAHHQLGHAGQHVGLLRAEAPRLLSDHAPAYTNSISSVLLKARNVLLVALRYVSVSYTSRMARKTSTGFEDANLKPQRQRMSMQCTEKQQCVAQLG